LELDMYGARLDGHLRTLEGLRPVLPTIARAAEELGSCLLGGRKVLMLGNGGSAADSQHFAAELVGRFVEERRALPAIALTTDTSILTAVGNDYGYERVFERQVEALGEEGDVLVAFSTSGTSPSVVRAATAAGKQGMRVIGLTGQSGGPLAEVADVAIQVPSTSTAMVQEAHVFILHAISADLDRLVLTTEGR
jgi:D-sedoheptulose 7-phosphate isomerase